jgi:hypothetical protein
MVPMEEKDSEGPVEAARDLYLPNMSKQTPLTMDSKVPGAFGLFGTTGVIVRDLISAIRNRRDKQP